MCNNVCEIVTGRGQGFLRLAPSILVDTESHVREALS